VRILRALTELTASFGRHDALVLCYHDVASRAMFLAQLRALEDCGYPPLTLEGFRRWLASDPPDQSRGALLTFDGGTRDQLHRAVPVLDARGAQGVFFPHSCFLEPDAAGPVDVMCRADVASLARAGHVVGSHTHTHRSLTRLAPATVEDEIATSKRVLEDVTGKAVEVFCYPYGDHDRRVRAIVARAGFDLAFTVDLGSVRRGHDPLALPRLCVLGRPPLSQFRAVLSGRFGVPGSLLLYWKVLLRVAPG
jgi:peptidoglycan/xylan/chitin deacetylase (PgdA/CDA1 family)